MKLPFPHLSSLTISQVVKARSLNMNSDGDMFLNDRFLKSEDREAVLSSEGKEDGEDMGHVIKEGEALSSSHEEKDQEDGNADGHRQRQVTTITTF